MAYRTREMLLNMEDLGPTLFKAASMGDESFIKSASRKLRGCIQEITNLASEAAASSMELDYMRASAFELFILHATCCEMMYTLALNRLEETTSASGESLSEVHRGMADNSSMGYWPPFPSTSGRYSAAFLDQDFLQTESLYAADDSSTGGHLGASLQRAMRIAADACPTSDLHLLLCVKLAWLRRKQKGRGFRAAVAAALRVIKIRYGPVDEDAALRLLQAAAVTLDLVML